MVAPFLLYATHVSSTSVQRMRILRIFLMPSGDLCGVAETAASKQTAMPSKAAAGALECFMAMLPLRRSQLAAILPSREPHYVAAAIGGARVLT